MVNSMASIIRMAAATLLLLLVAGCSGIKPWSPPDHREEGPTRGGLLTGPEGAWSIGVGGKTPAAPKPTVQDALQK